MISAKPIALLLAGILVQPALVAAQSLEPFAGYERTTDDLGTWDAVVEGLDRHGRRATVRVVEINTPGCDGGCVVTEVNGVALSPPAGFRQAAWWDAGGTGPASGQATTFYQTGMTQGSIVMGEGPATLFSQTFSLPLPAAAAPTVASVPPSRVSIERQGDDKRIVTLYRRGVARPMTLFGPAVDDTETAYLRITYTRRK